MKHYTIKPNKNLDNQMAFDYALYMILASLFTTTDCKSTLQESKLRIRYTELKKEKQYSFEEMCIHYAELHLYKLLPADLWKEPTTVYLISKDDDACTQLIFHNRLYSLCVSSKYRGKRTEFSVKLNKRKPEGLR